MSNIQTCPDTEQLRRFVGEDLPGNAHDLMADHVRQCEQCRAIAAVIGEASRSGVDSGEQVPPTRVGDEASGSECTLPADPGSPASGKGTRPASLSGFATLRPGEQLDRYLILKVLGQGGMGIVFRARDSLLERDVAIKTPGPFLAGNAVARKRFIREGRTAAAVKDTHVVTVYGVEGPEDFPYLVLEYVEGKSLEALLVEKGRLPLDDVVRLASQIAQGLAAAHQRGLIHRDIKPANILLEDGTGRVAITDFGLARAVDDASISRTGEICGTPHYMAPEQVCGGAIDHRADLFSLGSVLYYMCTGELPFSAPSSAAVFHRVLTEQPRPIWECNPGVPLWLAELITALHAKDPADRIQSAAEVHEALNAREAWLQTRKCRHVPAKPSAHGPRASGRASRATLAVLIGLVFLVSFPAFIFLAPRGSSADRAEPRQESAAVARNPQLQPAKDARPTTERIKRSAIISTRPTAETQRLPESTQTAPIAPKVIAEAPTPNPGRDVARVVSPSASSPPNKGVQAPKKPKLPSPPAEGVVVVVVNDPAGVAFLREQGLAASNQRTSEVVLLKQGRNYIALGDYKLEEIDAAAGMKVAPRRFSVTSERSVFINITRNPTAEATPPAGPPPPAPGLPFPPPLDHPRRPPPRP
jgi:serine/threonine protein kinase